MYITLHEKHDMDLLMMQSHAMHSVEKGDKGVDNLYERLDDNNTK